MPSIDDFLLNYEDAVLYRRDLKIVQQNQWLNDSIIFFWFQFLSSRHPSFHFIDPSVLNFWMMEPDEPITLSNSTFLAVSDGLLGEQNVNQGTHWSLLYYHDGTFEHLDSMCHSNLSVARAVAKRVAPNARVTKHPQPHAQQRNSFDCGIYVLGYCECLANGSSLQQVDPAALRQRIASTILSMHQTLECTPEMI